jgi:hypothetical protein
MQEVIVYLRKRRLISIFVVIVLALIAVTVSWNFHISRALYFNGQYNAIFIYSLIVYKILELVLLSYFLFYRHKRYLNKNDPTQEFLVTLKKHTKLLLFLIPQGNTIFGIIAYKLSGEVLYFLIFSCIALVTLTIINPNSLKVTQIKYT